MPGYILGGGFQILFFGIFTPKLGEDEPILTNAHITQVCSEYLDAPDRKLVIKWLGSVGYNNLLINGYIGVINHLASWPYP